jgi:hypothetical protein
MLKWSKRKAVWTNWRVDAQLTAFLTSTLHGTEQQASRNGKQPGTQWTAGWVSPPDGPDTVTARGGRRGAHAPHTW